VVLEYHTKSDIVLLLSFVRRNIVVKLRLRRVGKKKQPVYKIVATDSQASRSGKIIEAIGTYNPLNHPMVISVNEDHLFKWLKRGAQPTDTLRSLLQRKGLWLKWSMVRKGADEPTIMMAMERWQNQQEDKSRREAERKARRKAVLKKKKITETPETAATAKAETAPTVKPETAPTVKPETAPTVKPEAAPPAKPEAAPPA
jgi:small subunit ribosomal protein S16